MMKVICKKNICNAEIPACILPTTEHGKINWGNDDFVVVDVGGYSIGHQLDGYMLTIGREYDLFGVLQYNRRLRFLVRDDQMMPIFAPSSLFEIIDPSIPADWKLKTFYIEEGPLLVIGYEDLADDYDALISLVKSRPAGIKSFLNYVAWLEKWGFKD
ncbi:MAG: hypothetical protein IJM20_02615 [Clostridia bacterium]|nr:hypothetical protein [Clostridia bacterium]